MSGDDRNGGGSVSEAEVVRYWILGADAGNGLVELQAATSLVQKLNAAGANWAAPELTRTGSDAKHEQGSTVPRWTTPTRGKSCAFR